MDDGPAHHHINEQFVHDYFVDEQLAARPQDAHRHAFAFTASLAAHILVVLAIVFLAPAVERPHNGWVLAYLVEFDKPGAAPFGTGVRAVTRGRSAAPLVPTPRAPRAIERIQPREARVRVPAHHPHANKLASDDSFAAKRSRSASESETAKRDSALRGPQAVKKSGSDEVSSRSEGIASWHPSGRGSAREGEGDGSGAQSAHVEYGQNPAPAYPLEARRREQQGTVMLRVLVGADGSVARAEVVQSSGFDSLDDSAIETVRTQWRFIPARRAGIPVESWVEIPIQFALTEANLH